MLNIIKFKFFNHINFIKFTENHIFHDYLGCGQVNMGVYGCIWVYMGAVGHTITNAQANNTKRDRNGLVGHDFRPCMAGKFPEKTHTCAHRHKRVSV